MVLRTLVVAVILVVSVLVTRVVVIRVLVAGVTVVTVIDVLVLGILLSIAVIFITLLVLRLLLIIAVLILRILIGIIVSVIVVGIIVSVIIVGVLFVRVIIRVTTFRVVVASVFRLIIRIAIFRIAVIRVAGVAVIVFLNGVLNVNVIAAVVLVFWVLVDLSWLVLLEILASATSGATNDYTEKLFVLGPDSVHGIDYAIGLQRIHHAGGSHPRVDLNHVPQGADRRKTGLVMLGAAIALLLEFELAHGVPLAEGTLAIKRVWGGTRTARLTTCRQSSIPAGLLPQRQWEIVDRGGQYVIEEDGEGEGERKRSRENKRGRETHGDALPVGANARNHLGGRGHPVVMVYGLNALMIGLSRFDADG